MTNHDCCGRRPREISIDLTDTTLAFLYCARCERRQWLRNGVVVELDVVKETAASRWNRARASAPAA